MLVINGDLYMRIRILRVPKNEYAFGGLQQTHGGNFSNGLIEINEGGTHSENPYNGVPMGIAPGNQPNLVEQGEVIYKDYVFSNRLHPTGKELKEASLPERYKDSTFAYIAEKMGKESSERPNDPISRRSLEDSLGKLATVQEMQRQRKGKKGTQQMMASGGRKYDGNSNTSVAPAPSPVLQSPALPVLPNDLDLEDLDIPYIENEDIDTNYSFFVPYLNKREKARKKGVWVDDRGNKEGRVRKTPYDVTEKGLSTWLRYAPAVGSALGALHSIFQKPDYSNADILMGEADRLSSPSVKFRALNNYLQYRPLDRNYYLNQLKGQAGATRRAIMNSGSNAGNVMAGLLAADYNAQNAVGNALMQMEQYNDAQRQQIAQFNRGTDQYNSQAAMAADAQNAQIAQGRDRLRASLMSQAAQMREASDTALNASRSANTTNFFDNLGSIGRENMGWNWTKYLADSGAFGQLREGVPMPGFRKGGMLTKRNRRRR